MAQTPPQAQEPLRLPSAEGEEADSKSCRYCFDGEESGELIAPCACAGGQRWVHLACLRRWQRGVLVGQPTHPDYYDDDVRHRICNVCNSEYTCKPPSRLELMEQFTGEELAGMLTEGCLIVAYKEFSAEMQRNVEHIPEDLREEVIDRHWIEGVFIVLQVVEDGKSTILLQLSDDTETGMFLEQLSSDFCVRMHGRRFRLLFDGPLKDAASLEPEAQLDAVRSLQTPCAVMIRPADGADNGEDGITAVNLANPIDLSSSAHARKKACYDMAVDSALRAEPLKPEVRHFNGGPCRQHKASFSIVISGEDNFRIYTSLPEALTAAQQLALPREDTDQQVPVPQEDAGQQLSLQQEGAAWQFSAQKEVEEPKPKRQRIESVDLGRTQEDTSDAACVGAAATAETTSNISCGTAAAPANSNQSCLVASEQPPSRQVRVHVFWGAAGWSRCQLMGEIASGSWGLTKAFPVEVTSVKPEEVYERVYPRVVFAPQTEMSDKFEQQPTPEQHLARAAQLRRRVRRREQRRILREESAEAGSSSGDSDESGEDDSEDEEEEEEVAEDAEDEEYDEGDAEGADGEDSSAAVEQDD